jgi:hypothetical protein
MRSRDVRARSDDLGLDPSIVGGATARERRDIVGVVGSGVREPAAIGPARADALGGSDRDDVLGGRGRADCSGPRARVARGDDLDHPLVARCARLRVAHDRVELLRVGVVVAGHVGPPRVVRDPSAACVRASRQTGERPGELELAGAATEDLRTAQLHPRRDAEAVVEAIRVLDRPSGSAVEAPDDRRVDRAVATAVARVGVAGVVGDVGEPAGAPRAAALVQVGQVRGGRASVDALVGHVDDEWEGRCSPEAQTVVEAEIPGTARDEGIGAAEGAGDDLVGALVSELRRRRRLDRDDARPLGQRGGVVNGQLHELSAIRPHRRRLPELSAERSHPPARP